MIAIDTNILVYAHRRESPFHDKARALMDSLLRGDRDFIIPWPCAHEFYAIVTRKKIFKDPTPPTIAWKQIEVWLTAPSSKVLAEGHGYQVYLEKTIKDQDVRGPLIHDARIVALCLSQGVDTLLSADRDFNRFSQHLAIRNPLC